MAHQDVDSALLTPCPSVSTKLVLVALAHHRNHRTGSCHPSLACIERETGLHRVTVQKAVKELIGLDLLEVVGRGKRGLNFYRFKNLVVRPKEFQTDELANSSLTLPVTDSQSQTHEMQPQTHEMQPQAANDAASGCINRKEQEPEQEGEPAREDSPSSSLPDLETVRRQINTWFDKPADRPWGSERLHRLMDQGHRTADDWAQLGRFQTAPKPSLPQEQDRENLLHYRSQSIDALCKNFDCQFERAEDWEAGLASAAQRTPPRPYWLDPPCPEWQTLADQCFPGRDTSLDWDDFDASLQRELHTIFAKKKESAA